jgi:DNA modification methylase
MTELFPLTVHRTASATLYLGRAEDILPTFETESFDLVLTDPPYGGGYQSNFRTASFAPLDNDTATDRPLISIVLTECVRLVGQKRHLYVFGPDDVMAGLKVSDTTELVWDKGKIGMGDLSSTWGPAHEPITFCISCHRHAGKTGDPALAVRLRKGTVLRFNPPTGRKVRHPSEKPVPLLRELIESSSKQGETVLDPFGGSGSTAVAAILAGRKAVLIESDQRWFDLACERVEQAERAMKIGGAA